MFDVTVIGGGVVGALILRELSRYHLKALLLEAEDDVGTGASRANSGVVHAGYDCEPGSKKAYFNVKGNKMFPSLVKELHVPYKNTGSLVATDEHGIKELEDLTEKAKKNGVKVEIIGRERILEIEPNVSDNIAYALYAPEAGVVAPYKLVVAAADSAILNGAEIKLNERVCDIKKTSAGYTVFTESGQKYETKILINAAGPYASLINSYLNDREDKTTYRRGDYFVLDKNEQDAVRTVIFPLPDEHGKGILVSTTADGNPIYGPTAIPDCEIGENGVTMEGLNKVREGISKTYKVPNFRKVIRVFAGVRSIVGDDFIVEESKINPGYIIVMGICSPGLTSSPAIAEHVVTELVSRHISLKRKSEWKNLPNQKKVSCLSNDEINELIKENPLWGRVICRCETVSEAEIVEAIHSPLPATTVDAVKRRTRAGMGRCQGGFCMPAIIKILSRELNIPLTEVRKGGEHSEIAKEKIEVEL